jgi:hypothetical protein
LFFVLGKCFSQISPPGLGKAHDADWFAFGIRQELDTIEGKGWQSISYVGLGRKSNPDNYNPFYKSAILVINQEFYHQFHKTWQYSLALSYRRQDEYLDSNPYEHDNPKLKQEFRLYGRFSYIFSTSRIKLVPIFRQEFRKFYSPNFQNINENFQFRTRLRLQLKVNLDNTKQHRLIASSEQLFSISKENTSDTWTDFNYRESRFSLYYSYSPKTFPFIFSIGYMNNLVGQKNPYDVHYLAFDIVIENPFKLQQRNKNNINENLE